MVYSAGIQDRVGARALLVRLFMHFEHFKLIFVDGGYAGKLIDWSQAMFGWTLQVIKRREQHGFKVLPKRWIVERSFAWLEKCRRLWKNCERLINNSLQMVNLAFLSLLLKRL